jgi:type IV pilus assembly protein PilM
VPINIQANKMKRVFTLYIEDSDIRILLTNGDKVEKWAIAPLAPGMVKDGMVLKEEQVAKLIREQLKVLKIANTRVVLGLSGLRSLYRLVNLPVLPQAILSEAVRREAEKVMPISLSEVYLSYQVIPGTGGEMRVFIATYPRDAVDRLVKTVRKAGLVPHSMDLAPLALARTVTVPTALVIRARANNLDILVIVDKVPQVIRSLSLPQINSPMPETLGILSEEVERTVAFYNSTHEASPLDAKLPVFACGDVTAGAEYQEQISSKLGYAVSTLTWPLKAGPAFESQRFMVNIGLLLKELKRGPSVVDFNALPEVYRTKQVSPLNIVVPVGIIVGICVIGLLIFLVMRNNNDIATLRSQDNTIQSRIAAGQQQVKTLNADIKSLQDGITPLETMTKSIAAQFTALQAGRQKVNDDIAQVRDLLPPAVRLTDISQTTGSITLRGSGPNVSSIYQYAHALQVGQRFTLVLVTSIDQVVNQSTIQPPAGSPPDTKPTTVISIAYNFSFTLQ